MALCGCLQWWECQPGSTNLSPRGTFPAGFLQTTNVWQRSQVSVGVHVRRLSVSSESSFRFLLCLRNKKKKKSFAMLPSKGEKLHQQSHFIEATVENKLHGFSKQMNIPKTWLDSRMFCLPALVFVCTGGVNKRRMKLSEIVCGDIKT